jgi:hypothetical protein
MILNKNIYNKHCLPKENYFNLSFTSNLLKYKFDRNYFFQYYIDENNIKEINWKLYNSETFDSSLKNKIIVATGYIIKDNILYHVTFPLNSEINSLLLKSEIQGNINILEIDRYDIDNNKILVNNHIIDNDKESLYRSIWTYIVLDISDMNNLKFEMWDEGLLERDPNKLILGYMKFKFKSLSKYNLEIMEITQNKPSDNLYSLDMFKEYNTIRLFYDNLYNRMEYLHTKGYKHDTYNINFFDIAEHDFDYKLHNNIVYNTSFLKDDLLLSQQIEDKVWFWGNDKYDTGYFAHIINEWAHHIENSKLEIVDTNFENRKYKVDLKSKRSQTKYSLDLLNDELSLYSENDSNIIENKLPKLIMNRFVFDQGQIHLINDYEQINNNIPYYYKNIKYDMRIQKPIEIKNSDAIRYIYGVLTINDKVITQLFDLTKKEFFSFYEKKNFTTLKNIFFVDIDNVVTIDNSRKLFMKIYAYDENYNRLQTITDDLATINDYIITLDILSVSML